MATQISLFVAGLMGAAGVILAAAAAHAKPDAGLDNAAHMLLFHALAVIGLTLLLDGGRAWRPLAYIAVVGWLLGALLFAGDIALRAFVGARLFPMAAPTGGSLMILAWLAFSVSAAVGRS